MPAIFATIEAADLAHVAPWDMDAQSLYWQAHVREYHAINNRVANEKRQREERKRMMQGRRR